jgi:hypothetical protein
VMNNCKSSDAGSRSSAHNSGGRAYGGASNKASGRDPTKSGHGRSSVSNGTGSIRPGSRGLTSTRKSVGARSTTCPTVLTLEKTKLLPCFLSTSRRKTSKLWATTERRLTTEMARPRISRQNFSESRSPYWKTQSQTTQLLRRAVEDARKRGLPLKFEVLPVICRPDQFCRYSYVDDSRCLLVSSLPLLFYTISSHHTFTYINVKE